MVMNRAGPTSHIFIVGLARSGTHLVRSILNASDEIRVGPESQFLGGAPRLGHLARPGLLAAFPDADGPLSEAEAGKLIDRLMAGTAGRRPYWRGAASLEGAEPFRRRFQGSPRRARDLLAMAIEVHGRGKAIPGDKTPSNLFHVPQLLGWFPNARVIHILRDPRAVFASAMGKGFIGPKRLGLPALRPLELGLGFWWSIDLAAQWRLAVDLDSRYRQRFPDNYLMCRFEDLVGDPEPHIRRMCAFVGVPYRDDMVDRPVVSSSFIPRGTRGIRKGARSQWRSAISPPLARWITLLCGARLDEQGYPRT